MSFMRQVAPYNPTQLSNAINTPSLMQFFDVVFVSVGNKKYLSPETIRKNITINEDTGRAKWNLVRARKEVSDSINGYSARLNSACEKNDFNDFARCRVRLHQLKDLYL